MRYIEKGEEPTELIEYKKTPDVVYSESPKEVKDAIRRDGVRDQCGVCCYCCGPLADEPSYQQIEHLVAQSIAPSQTLAWNNLLVSCSSGRPDLDSSKRSELTCDDHKKNDFLPVAPLSFGCDERFLYVPETGAILARENDPDAERAIQILNLDCLRLRRGRVEAMAAAGEFFEKLPRKEWVRLFTMPVQGRLVPYEPAVRSLLYS